MFPVLTISGEPKERGQQYGAQAAALIRHSIASYARLFAVRRGLAWDAAQELALTYLPLLDKHVPDLADELRGIALGANRALGEIVALNARTELLAGIGLGVTHSNAAAALARNQERDVPEHGECTTLAALPEATANATTLLAQTWDWNGNQRPACVVLRIHEPHRPAALTVTEAGILAKIGLNSAGLGVALNILRSIGDGTEPGMPVHVLLRAVLQAPSLDEAVAMVERVRAGASSCITLAEAAGKAISLEVSPGGIARLSPENGLLAHTNHCLAAAAQAREAPFDPAISTVPRYTRARELLTQQHGQINTDLLMNMLRDHHNDPLCICRHPDERLDPIDRVESVLAAVMDLAAQILYLAPDIPCRASVSRLSL